MQNLNTPPAESKPGFSLKNKSGLVFVAAVTIMILIMLLPSPPPLENGAEQIALTAQGKAVMAVMVFAVILWLTEAIPFAVTSIGLLIILHFIGVSDFKSLVKMSLGNSVILFLMGCLGISAALTQSGLSRRIVLFVMSRVGTNTSKILFAFMLISTLLSWWITDMAVAAMMLPIGLSILTASNCKPLESNFGRILMLGIAWGALVGGIATPSGTGANILSMGFIRDLGGVEINFPQWMTVGVPASLMLVPVGWFLLLKIYPPEIKELPITLDSIKEDLRRLGPMSRKEKSTVLVFCLTVFLWLTGPLLKTQLGISIPAEQVAVIAFLLYFVPGLKVFDSWKVAEKEISWGSLLLIAGGLAAGTMLAETGAARYIAWAILSGLADLHPLLRVALVISLVLLLKIFFSSNAVTASVIMPIVIALALEMGMNPWIIAGPAAIVSTMGFIMVTSSPTSVIPYSSGYFTIADYAKAGVIMSVAAVIIATLSVAIFGRFCGMNIWM